MQIEWGRHVLCVIMTQCIQQLISDSPIKWAPLIFPGIQNPVAYLAKNSTTNVFFLKPSSNSLSIKGLHHP